MPNSSNHIQHAPPDSDEIEISLFGPGFGECCVIHLGDNEWLIIDSCLDPSTKQPTPISYLQSLGVDPAQAVKQIVISHWHTDHIRGASILSVVCENSQICFSEALLKDEFLTLVDIYSGLKYPVLVDRETSGTKEIASVIRAIKQRCENSGELIYNLLSADKRVYQRQYGNHSVEIWALSPSTESILDCLTEISNCVRIAAESQVRKVIPIPEQNHNAVVLLIKVNGESKILLGSDLEETSNPRTGWSAIVNSQARPQGKAQIFKIPHHGSENAHSHDVWETMLDSDAIGILTSKIGGRADIPKNKDIKRMKEYTSSLYCAAVPLAKKHKYDPSVEKTIKGVVKKRRPLYGEMGHIQLRIKNNSDVVVGLKAPAKLL